MLRGGVGKYYGDIKIYWDNVGIPEQNKGWGLGGLVLHSCFWQGSLRVVGGAALGVAALEEGRPCSLKAIIYLLQSLSMF